MGSLPPSEAGTNRSLLHVVLTRGGGAQSRPGWLKVPRNRQPAALGEPGPATLQSVTRARQRAAPQRAGKRPPPDPPTGVGQAGDLEDQGGVGPGAVQTAPADRTVVTGCLGAGLELSVEPVPLSGPLGLEGDAEHLWAAPLPLLRRGDVGLGHAGPEVDHVDPAGPREVGVRAVVEPWPLGVPSRRVGEPLEPDEVDLPGLEAGVGHPAHVHDLQAPTSRVVAPPRGIGGVHEDLGVDPGGQDLVVLEPEGPGRVGRGTVGRAVVCHPGGREVPDELPGPHPSGDEPRRRAPSVGARGWRGSVWSANAAGPAAIPATSAMSTTPARGAIPLTALPSPGRTLAPEQRRGRPGKRAGPPAPRRALLWEVDEAAFEPVHKEVACVVRCPSCGSPRVLVLLSSQRRARCLQCGYAWAPGKVWTSTSSPTAPHAELRRPSSEGGR